MIVLDDQINLFHSLECVAENVNDRPPRPFARRSEVMIFPQLRMRRRERQRSSANFAENVNDRPPRPFARQGNEILLSGPLDDQFHLFHSGRVGFVACVLLSLFCCGAFDFRLPGVSRFAVLVS